MDLDLSVSISRDDGNDATIDVIDRGHRPPQEHRMSFLAAYLGDPLPHLARTEPRVAELVDQGRHDLATVFVRTLGQQRGAEHRPEVEALDALGGPVGGQLL